MLVEMLKKNTAFSNLEMDQQLAYAKLAQAFEEDKETSLYLSPAQLTETLQIGNADLWFQFLNFEPVRAYIKAQTGFQLEVAARANVGQLAEMAQRKMLDIPGMKLLNDMADTLQGGSNRTVVVLHRVNRPVPTSRQLPDGTVEQL